MMGRIKDWSVLDVTDEFKIGEVACYWFGYEPYSTAPRDIITKVEQLTQLLVKENKDRYNWMGG